jgi:hypothetical protein
LPDPLPDRPPPGQFINPGKPPEILVVRLLEQRSRIASRIIDPNASAQKRVHRSKHSANHVAHPLDLQEIDSEFFSIIEALKSNAPNGILLMRQRNGFNLFA